MAIITLARELGSGGIDIANRVANALGIPCVDREIISQAAVLAGVNEKTIEELDEKCPPFIKQILEMMGKFGDQGIYTEWGAPATIYVPPSRRTAILDSETYRLIVEEVIRGIAEQQSAVIVGRAGQIILRDHPHALHVRVVADFEFRVKQIMEAEKLDRAAAEKLIRETDHQRSEYLRNYYRAEWRDPHLYDLLLNRSRLGMESCVSVILHTLAEKERVVADQTTAGATASGTA